jgi:hypothetical protein
MFNFKKIQILWLIDKALSSIAPFVGIIDVICGSKSEKKGMRMQRCDCLRIIYFI